MLYMSFMADVKCYKGTIRIRMLTVLIYTSCQYLVITCDLHFAVQCVLVRLNRNSCEILSLTKLKTIH